MNWGLKKFNFMIAALAAGSMLAACGAEIPDLTEEQTELVTDYSAALLLKYDSNTPSRLLPEDQANTILVDLPGQEAVTETTDPGMDVSDDVTPEVSSEDVTVTDTTDPDAPVEGQGFDGLLGDPGFAIEYSGNFEVADSYPNGDDTNAYFAMDATAGNKLLIIHFNLTNTSGSNVDVNMNEYSVKYRVSVNGGKNRNVMTTLLSNDILSYEGTLEADQTTDLVAVAEIPEDEAGSIQTLQFVIRGDTYNATINLQ